MDRLLTLGELARELQMPQHALAYHIQRGHLPDAAYRVGGRRAFTVEQIQVIKEMVQRMRRQRLLKSA